VFPELVAKKRNAWLLNTCLSPDATPQNLDFLRKINKTSTIQPTNNLLNSSIQEQVVSFKKKSNIYRDSKGQTWTKLRIPCFPLFSITSALNVSKIDFLLLDTQGLELQILLNIPWDEIEINVRTKDKREQ
jgi:hypothetical protein